MKLRAPLGSLLSKLKSKFGAGPGNKWTRSKKRKNDSERQSQSKSGAPEKVRKARRGSPSDIPADLDAALRQIEELTGKSDDIVIRRFEIGLRGQFRLALIYVDGLINRTIIDDMILKGLLLEIRSAENEWPLTRGNLEQMIERRSLSIGEVKRISSLDKLVLECLSGNAVLLQDGSDRALSLSARGWPKRGVDEAKSQATVRGPRDAFTETIRENTALIRRRIKDPSLRIETVLVGRRTRTAVSIVYLKGVVNPNLVSEVRGRLDTVDIDSVLGSGYIEQMIEDNWLSPLPQVLSTERPDQAAGAILEGRVAILVDTAPFVMIVPAPIDIFFKSPEDYHDRWFVGSFIRFVRFVASLLAVTLPAIYIALVSFHPEMIPTKLARAIAASREGVPFPAFLEAFLMEAALELLREAGIRLPGPIGQTISIVGGLVVGDAAVRANIVSPIMVIVVAATAISSFTIPNWEAAISLRLLRFPLMVAASIFGLFGLMTGVIIIVTHAARLKTFGVSYLEPWSDTRLADLKDTLIRGPWPAMHKRPSYLHPLDAERMHDRRQDSAVVAEKPPGAQPQGSGGGGTHGED